MEVTGKEGVTFFKRGVRFYTMGKVGGGMGNFKKFGESYQQEG